MTLIFDTTKIIPVLPFSAISVTFYFVHSKFQIIAETRCFSHKIRNIKGNLNKGVLGKANAGEHIRQNT
jgi:hypothetical protein